MDGRLWISILAFCAAALAAALTGHWIAWAALAVCAAVVALAAADAHLRHLLERPEGGSSRGAQGRRPHAPRPNSR
ncbi:MAG TPA: hypothetical protein VMT10_14275 [Solirubrobacteraceae bacterium]|nr:hypothetical protein [Solirubrobacteraceae bacterium]